MRLLASGVLVLERAALVGCTMLCTIANVAAPQMTHPAPVYYAVDGSVADDAGNVLGGAQIELIQGDSIARRLTGNESGHFRLDSLPSPHVVFRVRHVGYEPATHSLDVTGPDHRANVLVKLNPTVARLAGVRIEDSPPEELSANLQAFRERQANNRFGHYIDAKQLAALHPQYTSEALRGVAGVSVTPSKGGANQVLIRGCAPLVWVDGIRAPGAQLDDVTSGGDVAALEIYNSFAGVPAQFLDRTATCGTILVWLK